MFPCFQRMDFPASHVKLPEDRQMLCGFDCGSVPVPWWPAFPGASLAVCKCRASEESEETGWLLGICALLLQIYEKMGPLQKRVPGYPNLWYLMMGCWIIIFHIDMAWMGVSSMSGRTHRPSQRRHSNITHTHTHSQLATIPPNGSPIKRREHDDKTIHLHIWSYLQLIITKCLFQQKALENGNWDAGCPWWTPRAWRHDGWWLESDWG